jgi:hypothetical protein
MPIPSNPEYRIDQHTSLTYVTLIGLEFGSATGTQITTSGEYRVTDYETGSVRSGLETRSVGATVSHALSRSASFSVGYHYGSGEFGFDGPSHEHRTAVGISYSPPLSRTRRLDIHLNANPSWLQVPAPAVDPAVTTIDTYLYRMQGDVGISYPFMPNWRVAATYHRGVEYLAGLDQPLLSDGTRAELTGLIARRVDLAASFGLATATSAVFGATGTLDTYTGTVKVRYALKRSLAVYSEYLYYYYDQGGQSSLVPDLPAVFKQHGIRVGLTLFIEALDR